MSSKIAFLEKTKASYLRVLVPRQALRTVSNMNRSKTAKKCKRTYSHQRRNARSNLLSRALDAYLRHPRHLPAYIPFRPTGLPLAISTGEVAGLLLVTIGVWGNFGGAPDRSSKATGGGSGLSEYRRTHFECNTMRSSSS